MNNFFIGMCICFLLIIIFIGLLIFVIYKRKKDIKEIGKTIWNNLLRIIVICNMLIICMLIIYMILEMNYSTIILGIALIMFISILLFIFNKKISKNKIIMFFVLLIYFLICYITPVCKHNVGLNTTSITTYKNCYVKSLYRDETYSGVDLYDWDNININEIFSNNL